MYPNQDETIDILITAAKRAAQEANVQHAEDIAYAMLNAIEAAWPVILDCYERFTKN